MNFDLPPRGRGQGRGRGRRRVERSVDPDARYWCYAPVCGGEDREIVPVHHDELEVLKLIDLHGLSQEEAAAVMGVSRKTVWRDLHAARRKITGAILSGKTIVIAGCDENTQRTCRFFPGKEDGNE